MYIVNNNVSFSGGVAKFSGKSRLRVPQLSNVDYGDSVMLRIRFRDSTNSSGRPQALISNADCGNNASILIAKDKDRIIFGAHTENGGYNQIELPKPVRWKIRCGLEEIKLLDKLFAFIQLQSIFNKKPRAWYTHEYFGTFLGKEKMIYGALISNK